MTSIKTTFLLCCISAEYCIYNAAFYSTALEAKNNKVGPASFCYILHRFKNFI